MCFTFHKDVDLNINFTLTCDTCQEDIDCRLGFSNRRIQPLRFSCPHCSSLIGLTLDTTSAPGYQLDFANAELLDDHQYGMFDGRHPFVDLHLDFPVQFGAYTPGLTPYFAAIDRLRDHGQVADPHLALAYFNQRLNHLNYFADRSQAVTQTIRLYFGNNKQLFLKRVQELVDRPLSASLLPQDINAALYLLIARLFLPFIHPKAIRDFVEGVTAMIMELAETKAEAFNTFIDHIVDTKFLFNIQKDCVDLYPEIYKAELALRPAIFLDLLNGSEDALIAGRVSADEFPTYKDLYKDICEVVARQLILVAGINNLVHRGSHDEFAPSKDGAALSSLDKFADKTLSEKFKYLDDCWFDFDKDVVNAGVRNAIAHHITEYDEATQLITYFPDKEGVRQEKAMTMTFLAFVRLILQIFREMHYLHQLIKCLLNYQMLIRNERRGAKD